jgi:hypothetical protein
MEKKYLVYKTAGGICHMLRQINNAIHLSKITNRYLIIDCVNGEAFRNDFNKYFNIPDFNYSTNYNCLYEDDLIENKLFESYVNSWAGCYGNTYFLNYDLNDKIEISIMYSNAINNNDNIIYCTWISDIPKDIPWYIRVNKNILDKISINKINEKYIGLHYRNCDWNQKHNLEDHIPKIFELLTETNIVYLATDDHTAFDRLNILLDNKFKIVQYTKPINNNGYNLHLSNTNKDELIMTSLIDMYHLTYATYFIPSINSGWYERITKLRKNDNFFK